MWRVRPWNLNSSLTSPDTYSYYDSARMALEGGCRWIQLRMKDTPVDEVEREAIRLQGLCKDYGATFVIDDHVELVKKIHADGVHLGKKDMPGSRSTGNIRKRIHHRRHRQYI